MLYDLNKTYLHVICLLGVLLLYCEHFTLKYVRNICDTNIYYNYEHHRYWLQNSHGNIN